MKTSLKRIILVITLGLLMVAVALLAGSLISTYTKANAAGQPATTVCTPQALPANTHLPAPAGLPSKGVGNIGFSQTPACLPCPSSPASPTGTPTGTGKLPLSTSPCPSSGKK